MVSEVAVCDSAHDGVLPRWDDAELRARQHQVLVDVDLLDVPGDAELDAITRVAAALAGTDSACINLLDTDRQCQLSAFGFIAGYSPRSESLCARSVAAGDRFASPDLSVDPRFADSAWVDGRLGRIRRYAAVPLIVDGTPVGSLCVVDRRPGPVEGGQLDRLGDLAEVVVALLLRHRANRLGEAARAELLRTQAFDRALLEALPVGVVAADADRRITLFNQVSRQWHGNDTDPGLSPDELPAAYDLYEADGVTPLPVDRVPLLRVFGEGPVSGAEIVLRPHGREARNVSCSGTEIRDSAGRFLGAVVAMADVTAQRELEERLRSAALHDGLTGLPNRSLLVDRLTHALLAATRDSSSVAVLYCDLDGFKAVNDVHGHAAGDEVLIQAALRLAGAVRPGDTVARIGGDEFVLLCPGVDGLVTAEAIADRVVVAMGEPLRSSAARHRVGVSVGVALSGPDSTAETMITAADEEMYRVKRARHGAARRG